MTPAMMTLNPMLTMLHLTAGTIQTAAEIQSKMLRQWAEMIPRSEEFARDVLQTTRQAVPPKNVAV